MEPQYAVLDDIEYDACRYHASGFSARASQAIFHAGAILAPSGVTMTPEFSPDPKEIHTVCSQYGYPYLTLSGTVDQLSEFLRHVYSQCQGKHGQEDRDCFLRELNTSEPGSALVVLEFNTVVTAMHAPAIGKYPANIPEQGKVLWDTVLGLPTYQRAVQGQPVEVKWAIAVKFYTARALKVGAKPFVDSKKVYTRKALTDEYNQVLARVGGLEQQLRNNMIARGYISPSTTPWEYQGVSYDQGNLIIETQRTWSAIAPGPKILGSLVRTEGFKKNAHGAGYVLPVSRSALLRIRVRKGSGQVTVNLFTMFTRDKITHTFDLDPKMPIRELLPEFESIAKRWHKTKRF